MNKDEKLTPIKAANHLNKIAKLFHNAHGSERFPIDVDQIAKGCGEIFKWNDPIVDIEEANIPNFEGMLFSNDEKTKWKIAYNSKLNSEGRIRFTKAHELGHYVLHRQQQEKFLCSKDDMLEWSNEENIESQADLFASYLLMPLDDFRSQLNGSKVNLDILSHCADRYGVSLTATILKWLSYTPEKAVLVMSNDGFINWASSSNAAVKAGAYFKTRRNVIELPTNSLAKNENVLSEKQGTKISSKTWFPHADTDSNLLEMKIFSDQYDSTLSLLVLPKHDEFWPTKK